MGIETLQHNFMELTSDAVAVGCVPASGETAEIVYVNPAFSTLFGYTSVEIIGQLVDVLHDTERWDEFTKKVQAKFRAGDRSFVVEARMVRSDGSLFWASVSFIVATGEQSGKRYVCATYRDISDLKAAEETAKKALETRDFAHERLMAALNAYPDPIVIYNSDLLLVSWNQAYALTVSDDLSVLSEGMSLRAVLELMVKNKRIPAAYDREQEWINKNLTSGILDTDVQDMELHGDIHHRLLQSRSAVGDYVVIRVNTTEFVRQKRTAEAAENRLIAALNAYPAPFAIYDNENRLVVWNNAYETSMTDNTSTLYAGMSIDDAARMAIAFDKFPKHVAQDARNLSTSYLEREREMPVQDLELAGDIHHRLLRSRAENGDLVLLRIDTTELVRQRRAVEEYALQLELANEAITYKASHDELTSLGNRRHLSENFQAMIEKRNRYGGEIAALHIDLDWFKQINDTLGHAAGDQVLLVTSNRILAATRSSDIVARIGGDEFIVLQHVSAGSRRPQRLAERLLADLSVPTQFEGKECRCGASIGLARTPLSDVDSLLINSDVALYKAKRQGRGQLGIFDHSDLQEMREKKQLADDLRRAVERSEFVPFYHIQVDAASNMLVGVEALARWQHPERGLLTPDQFLPVATDLNLVSDIDRMIFEGGIAECQQLFGDWAAPPSLSFNVSQKRVNGDEFDLIRLIADNYAGRICFELLETIFLEEETAEFLFQLDRLRESGIGIEVDDFGSGRASVVALQRIGPERLKIDRRLVAQVAEGDSGLRLIQSIVEIGLALGMGVTAEGVETHEQAEILARLGCDRLQGYLFAKPMDFNELRRFLEAEKGVRARG